MKRKIVFLTGTRADFGKIKSLISILFDSNLFEVHIFATGMHLSNKYGHTVEEIMKCGFPNVYQFINDAESGFLDTILVNTITGFGHYIKKIEPDMIIVHGDRVEALAGAIAGSFNNILVAHIEGGELSGTIDEHIRHTISKLSHVHFVANKEAQKRLIQMGESKDSIYVIGSPDLDIMISKNLPSIDEVKKWYDIHFSEYAIVLYHPVTTEIANLWQNADMLSDVLLESKLNYIIVYPNNDPGTDIILNIYKEKLCSYDRFRIIPSIRFEYFLTLIKNTQFLIGNSSAGIREAPFYGIPSIDIGSRQKARLKGEIADSASHCEHDKQTILNLIRQITAGQQRYKPVKYFGDGDSSRKFFEIIKREDFWQTGIQKQFLDIDY